MKNLLFLSLLIFSFPSLSWDNLSQGQKNYWNKLLHYRANTFGQLISEVDASNFFLSEEGKKSPQKEFEANINILNSNYAKDYVCRFPLRYQWLKNNTKNEWNYTTEHCDVYNAFVGKLGAKSLSLVFSSFYVNNPGSTFGHTFLRIGRKEDFRSNEMLDWAINFAAEDGGKDNVVLYMLKGLAGFYPGKFSVIPYYYKIREYNDHEFRDIWDYDLKLNQKQVLDVIDHVWELANSHFDYFYFTENCSYHILGLLNVAYKDIDIMDELNSAYVLPIDTVKVMKRLGLIHDKKVRASSYQKLLKETQGLKYSALENVKKIAEDPIKNKSLLNGLNDVDEAKMLDASISAIDYLKATPILLKEKKATEEREVLLVARAENPEISESIIFDEKTMVSPDDGHDSTRVSFSLGNKSSHGNYSQIGWRAAQHELLDPSAGHLKNSQVVMFDLHARLIKFDDTSTNFIFEKLRLVDLKKYQASDFWNSSISFDLGIGFDQKKECISQDCINPITTFGVGNTVEFLNDYQLTFLLGGEYRFDQGYTNNSLFSLGPKLNFLTLKNDFSLGIDYSYFLPTSLFYEWYKPRHTFDLEGRWFMTRQINLFLKSHHRMQEVGDIHETQVGLNFYY